MTRNKFIKVRVTEEEAALFRSKAAALGMSASEYIRVICQVSVSSSIWGGKPVDDGKVYDYDHLGRKIVSTLYRTSTEKDGEK